MKPLTSDRSPGDLIDASHSALPHHETYLGLQDVDHPFNACLAERRKAP